MTGGEASASSAGPPRPPARAVERIDQVRWTRLGSGEFVALEGTDLVTEEEPLEIRLCFEGRCESATVTMRTPGDDRELAAGLLFAEGVLHDPDEVAEWVSHEDEGDQVLDLRTRRPLPLDPAAAHRFLTTSSCGVCGRTLIRGLFRTGPGALGDPTRVEPAVLARLPERLREAQRIFSVTGGLHAAGLFDPEGNLLAAAEDIGRHNAVDKVVGRRFLARALPARGTILQVSGRVSFEIVQKAAAAQVPILSAVSAPSALAVRAADAAGITLVGFARGDRLTAYAHPERIGPRPPAVP
jgi:FdhD protein